MRRLACLLFILSLAAALPAADALPAENLVSNGNFEAVEGSAAKDWKWGDPKHCSIQEENGNKFLRLDLKEKGAAIIQREMPLDPDWSSMRLGVRIRAKNLVKGAEGWQSGMLQYICHDAAGKQVGGWPKLLVEKDQDWTAMKAELLIPDGAAKLTLQCAVLGASGTVDFDDVFAVPVMAGTLPEGTVLAWGEEPVETVSAKRARICLNGVWNFAPAVGKAEADPAGSWGFIRVPGSWREISYMPGLVARGRGEAWKDFDGKALSKAWYERKIRIPADWAGRAVLLDFRRISTDAVVYVNGKECGKVESPYGTVDITAFVKPGEEATLRVLVIAVQTAKEALVLMGVGQNTVTSAKPLSTKGLIGDVILESRPAGAFVSDVFVQTSVRKKAITFQTELTGAATGEVEFTARILDGQGRETKRLVKTHTLEAAQPVQTVSLTFPWADAQLWDIGQPNLYTVQLAVKGAKVDDEYAQGFGFREFWIEGRKLFLNGTEIRLRPDMFNDNNFMVETMDAEIDGMVWAGYNIGEMWPWDHADRGRPHFRELMCERADRKGFAVMGPALSAARIVQGWRKPNWNDPGVKEEWAARMEHELRRYRNHPSILLWAFTANSFGHGDDQNPRRMGQSRGKTDLWPLSDKNWHEHQARGDAACAVIRAKDPTRPVMIHQGGPVSDIYALNNYLCLIPLQEREEWLSEWAKSGDMPYLAVEFGTPLHSTFMRGRDGFGNTNVSEPLMTEFCTIYLGTEAYRLESPEYRAKVRDKFVKDQEWKGWQLDMALEQAPAFQAIQTLFNRNTWRSWRTMGVTAGMIPWHDAHGWRTPHHTEAEKQPSAPFQPGRRGVYHKAVSKHMLTFKRPGNGTTLYPSAHALMANNAPTLAWIAGRADAFTEKSHHFVPGQTVTKQAVILNDTRATQEFKFAWEAKVDGQRVGGGEQAGRIETAGTQFFPLTFALPTTLAKAKVDGEITLTATVGGKEHKDSFAFRVFGPEPKAQGTIAVVDPDGKTTALLQRLGYTVSPWDGKKTDALLVIGRNALSKNTKLPGDLRAFVQAGGRAVLCAQDPEWLRRYLGLRVAQHASRRVFRIDTAHPVVAGLDESDLTDWAGEGTLLEPYPDYINKDVPRATGAPTWGWRWGNRGTVCSAPVEKPHLSSWRPILECEFDLAYSPLLEMDDGAGRLTLCTFDFEDQAPVDPAALKLARQTYEYARTAPLAKKAAKVVYVGGEAGAKLLAAMGLIHERSEKLDATGDLLVVGPEIKAEDVKPYLENGGRAFFLARTGSDAGLGVTLEERKLFGGSLNVPPWAEARGLSASDLRWRTDAPAWVVKSGGEIGADGQFTRVAVGKGVAIFCQLNPDALNAGEKSYFRFTRWRQTRAIAQVLANLGASFKIDGRIYAPEDPEGNRVALVGQWKVKQTVKLPNAEPDKKPQDTGISDEAKTLVAEQVDDAAWADAKTPGMWEGFGDTEGEAIFRFTVEIPKHMVGKDLVVQLGIVDDFDDTYFNGQPIGRTDNKTPNTWNFRRVYAVPANLVKEGKNTIAVRCWDHFGGGGFGGPRHAMVLRLKDEPVRDSFYHSDYREDFEKGDDPYRYFRW